MRIILSRSVSAPELVISGVDSFHSDNVALVARFADIKACDAAKSATGWDQCGPLTLRCPKWTSMNKVFHYEISVDGEEHSYARIVFTAD